MKHKLKDEGRGEVKPEALVWREEYHDSKAWLYAEITPNLIVVMESWGPMYAHGGRYEKLKTWQCMLMSSRGAPIATWSTCDAASRDVADDEAKCISLSKAVGWLKEELEAALVVSSVDREGSL